MKISFSRHAVALAGLLTMAGLAQANQEPGLYIVPYVGFQTFDNDLSLDDDSLAGLALGRQLPGNWAVELAYSQTNTRTDHFASKKVDTDYWHFDALYQFPIDDHWSPYAVFGIGGVNYKIPHDGNKDTQVNVGAGIQYSFNSRFAIRTDIRGLMAAEEVHEGTVVNIGLVYALGKCDTKKAKPMQAAEPVAKVAEPAVTPVPVMPVVEKDTDGDGVMDDQDKCPDTSKGAKVDAEGCYVALEKPREFTLNVKFKTGKSAIQEASKGQVADLAAFLTQYPQTKVTIEGHTDSDGSAEYNRLLSQKRAEAVRQSLINDYQVAADRLTAIGYGEDKPIADNATAEGKAQNRRVVVKVSTQKQ